MSVGKSLFGISGIICIVLVSISIVVLFKFLHTKYMDIFSIDYLWESNYCRVLDENNELVIDKKSGSIFGKDGMYSIEYCAFHPLFLTDPAFREKTLELYSIDKIFASIKNFFTGEWTLPDQNLIQKDPVLASMILNPWYTSDDIFYTQTKIQYTFDLSEFIIGDKKYSNFNTDKNKPDGMQLSWYKKYMNTNIATKTKCEQKDEVACNTSPAMCKCSYTDNEVYYLFMDTNVMIQLPMQLYLGKLPDSQSQNVITVKVKGKTKKIPLAPIRITKLDDLKTVLADKFYAFKNIIKSECNTISDAQQKSSDSKCKFFKSDALAGVIIALKRIIIINIPESVRDDFIKDVDNIIAKNLTLNYLQFFLWLAAKSHRDKITYDFVPYKKKLSK